MTEKPDYIKVMEEYFEKNKPPTLYEIIADWWDEIFMNGNPSGQNIESLVDTIESEWLPKESEGSIDVLQWNKCVRRMKETLR